MSTAPPSAASPPAPSSGIPAEWVSTWSLFNDRDQGSVSATDLKHILRSLGRRHTESEFRDMLQALPDPVPFEAFVHLMQLPYSGPTEDDLSTALRAFDANGSGSLQLAELITLLSTLGEKMPEAEVRQLLSGVATDEDGRVRIEDLVQLLCTPVPSTTVDIEDLQRQLNHTTTP